KPPSDDAYTPALHDALPISDRTSTVEMKLDGKKVSGTATAPSGEYPFIGEFVDGKLSFTMDYQNLKIVFAGALKDDGTLAGTMEDRKSTRLNSSHQIISYAV